MTSARRTITMLAATIVALGAAGPAQGAGTPAGEPGATLNAIAAGRTPLGFGDSGPAVTYIQTRLGMAGLASGVKPTGVYDRATEKAVVNLQEKFLLDQTGQVDADTLAQLKAVTRRNGVLPHQCLTANRVICVDKTSKTLRFLAGGSLAKPGGVAQTLDVRYGVDQYATREGLFSVYRKVANDYSWLSNTPMRYSMYFSGGQAVHHSDWFVQDGYDGGSLGCVHTRDLNRLAWIFARTPVGTRVYIYR